MSREGLLRSFEAVGHAGEAARGANVACAAATALLRTTARLCAERAMVGDGDAGHPGAMRLVVAPRGAPDEGWLKGVTDFLLRGMRDLKDEFPRAFSLDVEIAEG